jgi:hypothetical protein
MVYLLHMRGAVVLGTCVVLGYLVLGYLIDGEFHHHVVVSE